MGEPEGDIYYAGDGEGLDVPAGGFAGGAGGEGGTDHVADGASVPADIDANFVLDAHLFARLWTFTGHYREVNYGNKRVECYVARFGEKSGYCVTFSPGGGSVLLPPNLVNFYYAPPDHRSVSPEGWRFCRYAPSPDGKADFVPLTREQMTAVVDFLKRFDAPFRD